MESKAKLRLNGKWQPSKTALLRYMWYLEKCETETPIPCTAPHCPLELCFSYVCLELILSWSFVSLLLVVDSCMKCIQY